MTLVIGLLALGDHRARPGFPAAKTVLVAGSPGRDSIFLTEAPLDRARWRGIVIHHSGKPAGDAESVRRHHLGLGLRAMGYHFLIGNGNGMGDGVVHVGERWVKQLPGAHTVGSHAEEHNRHSIGICLIGNGDRRAPTSRQIAQLISLIERLQRALDIPSTAVSLHRDIAPRLTTSPGRFFPTAALEQHLLDRPR